MIVFALASLAFSAWMAWTLAASVRELKPVGFREYLSTGAIAVGSMSGIVVALSALARAVL